MTGVGTGACQRKRNACTGAWRCRCRCKCTCRIDVLRRQLHTDAVVVYLMRPLHEGVHQLLLVLWQGVVARRTQLHIPLDVWQWLQGWVLAEAGSSSLACGTLVRARRSGLLYCGAGLTAS